MQRLSYLEYFTLDRLKLVTSFFLCISTVTVIYHSSLQQIGKCLQFDLPVFSHIEDYNCPPTNDAVGVKDCFLTENLFIVEPKCLIATENDKPWDGLPFTEGFHYSIEPSCSHFENKYLIIYVYSQVYHFKERQNLRLKYKEYLGNKLCQQVKVLFIIGEMDPDSKNRCYQKYEEMLEIEAFLYRDLLRINIIDSYYNLSYKGFGAIHWIARRCNLNVPFMLKMDDDFSLDLRKLINTLDSLDCNYNQSQMCYGINDDEVVRIFWSKFKVQYLEFGDHDFPLVCGGHAMLTTQSTARHLYDVANDNNLPLFRVDDVYFGALLRRKSCIRLAKLLQNKTKYYLTSDKWKEW